MNIVTRDNPRAISSSRNALPLPLGLVSIRASRFEKYIHAVFGAWLAGIVGPFPSTFAAAASQSTLSWPGPQGEAAGCQLCVVGRLAYAAFCRPSIYLEGIDNSEIINTVHRRPAPVLPASAGLC